MDAKLTIDTRRFATLTRAIGAELKQDLATALKGQAKLYLGDCVALTPPFVPPGFAKDKLGPQRKQGQEAVKRDIESAFKPVSDMRTWIERESTFFRRHPKAQAQAVEYIRSQNFDKLKEMLRRMKRGTEAWTSKATKELHKSVRGSRGRVLRSAKSHPFIVEDSKSVDRLIRQRQGMVGFAKSGWKTAATALGLRLPAWITKHNGPGLYSGPIKTRWPELTLGNAVPFIQAAGAELNIMREAMRQRVVLMERQLRRTIEANFRKANKRR